MALGTLHAAFSNFGIEAAVGHGGVQSRGGAGLNQRPTLSGSSSNRNNAVSLSRAQQLRVGSFAQSASAFVDADFRQAAFNKGQRGSFAVPLPDFISVRRMNHTFMVEFIICATMTMACAIVIAIDSWQLSDLELASVDLAA